MVKTTETHTDGSEKHKRLNPMVQVIERSSYRAVKKNKDQKEAILLGH